MGVGSWHEWMHHGRHFFPRLDPSPMAMRDAWGTFARLLVCLFSSSALIISILVISKQGFALTAGP